MADLQVTVTKYDIPADTAVGQAAVVALLDGATQRIRVEGFQLSFDPFLRALTRAHQRGVDVLVMVEHTEAGTPTGVKALHALFSYGFPPQNLRITTSQVKHAFAHKKVAVIDGATTVDGSTNWSNGAWDERNHLLIIASPEYAEGVEASWQQHWEWTEQTEVAYTEAEDTAAS